ncbi:hypothetical protein FXO37_22371 [Capsicum annuum]|nr:hypothetical protein FXO37_22371 [Capsicum annuum]
MESASLASGFLKNRRFGSYFDASSGSVLDSDRPREVVVANEKREEVYGDDDGWVIMLISWIRMLICVVVMMFTTLIWAVIYYVVASSLAISKDKAREYLWTCYWKIDGMLLLSLLMIMCQLGIEFDTIAWFPIPLGQKGSPMWILGNPITIEGLEYSEETAIYISNHASLIDIFLIMWLTPTGTVGVAKKEIIWYLFIGQLYVLANHLRIDRSNPAAAIESMKEGFVHLALQTRRPIVPIVMTNTHLAWRKGSLHVRPAPLTVKFLPPIRTDDWTADKIDDYVKMVHDVYVKKSPPKSEVNSIEIARCSLFKFWAWKRLV